MKTGYSSLLWSAAALALLLSAIIPGLNLITVPLVMVPYTVLCVTLPPLYVAIYMLVVWGAALLLGGPVGPIAAIAGVFFAVPAIVMGYLYRRRAPAKRVLTGTTLALLAMLLVQLLVLTFGFDYSPIQEMSSLIRDSVAQMASQGVMPADWDAELTESFIRTLTHSVPVAMMALAFVYAAGAQWLARRALRTAGLEMPRFQRAKDWMLPKVLVLYYLVVLAADMLVAKDDGSFLSVALLNLQPLLQFAFMIQTIGFFFYLANQKRWHGSIPLLLAVPVLLFPPLNLIGVLDVAFPIRKSFVKP